ncbi:butyrophilin subfamily 1 member A1-like [Coregonus clupeaformis]|uniref:butyrophilin subfamily 1 member A1-like n=1 Tax=Coregonus clupeaformis TaxID=59861 RepID=UPI001E1C7167|nr:butyrophilin subfamily 1 member A1-like [Coregonus clupeaformis]
MNVLGGIPVLSVAETRGGGGLVNVTCSSEGWSPQPTLTWRNKEGTEIRNGQEVLNTPDPQGLVSVSSWLLYSPSDSDWLSCTVSLSEEVKKESRILPRAPTESHWSLGAFITTPIILLLVFTVIGLFIWNKKTDKTESTERPEETALFAGEVGKNQVPNEECGMQTAKETTTQKDVNVPKAWGEVKRFKVEITLDPKSAHPNLDVYASKMKSKVTDVPMALHVFSEDRFRSGQLYWEVKSVPLGQ